MSRNSFIVLLFIFVARIIADLLNIELAIGQISRDYDAFNLFFHPQYLGSLIFYTLASSLIIHLVEIGMILIGLIGLFNFIKNKNANRMLMLYFLFKIYYSFSLSFLELNIFSFNAFSNQPIHLFVLLINLTTPLIFLLLLFSNGSFKNVFQPNFSQNLSLSSSLHRALYISLDFLFVVIIFFSLYSRIEQVLSIPFLGLLILFIFYPIVCIIYFKNSLSTIITKTNLYDTR